MTHPLLRILLHNRPVLLPTANPARLAKLDHNQEHRSAGHTDKSRRNEAVLVSHIIDPGRDTNRDGLALLGPFHKTELKQ